MFFLNKRKKDPLKSLKRYINDYEVPSFPVTVMNSLTMLRDPMASITEISNQIQMDPGMHVKILRLVNSVSFGLATKVNNLHHAITLLGRARLESMVLSFAVTESIPVQHLRCMDLSLFWHTSAKRASLARILALHLHASSQAECFTSALLQDMALPVIIANKNDAYCKVLERWHENPETRLDHLEREIFGFDHAALGSMMAETWELPELLVNSFKDHHDPPKPSDVYPAIKIASCLTYSDDQDGTDQMQKICQQQYDIEEDLFRSMVAEAFAEAERFSSLFI